MMRLNKIWRYFCGYVRIRIRGRQPEKFLNICLRRGISVWDLTRRDPNHFELCLYAKDFKKKLKQVALKSRCSVHILEKNGFLFFLRRYRKRKLFAVGAVILCALFVLLSSMLWSVEVTGGQAEDILRTKTILKNLGIQPGILIDSVSTQKLSEQLLAGQPELAWVGVKKQGTKMYIELKRGTFYEPGTTSEVPEDMPCDIVAAKDAVIRKIVVEQGVPVLQEDVPVQKGQIIISGTVRKEDLPEENALTRYVHARGTVRGIVWYSAEAAVETEVTVYRPTGNENTQKTILLFGLRIPLPGKEILPWVEDSSYQNANSIYVEEYITLPGGTALPIGISKRMEYEMAQYVITVSPAEAADRAELKAMDLLNDKIPDAAEILDTKVEWFENESGVSMVRITAECAENIGIDRALTE